MASVDSLHNRTTRTPPPRKYVAPRESIDDRVWDDVEQELDDGLLLGFAA
jgi:hypothetical protein